MDANKSQAHPAACSSIVSKHKRLWSNPITYLHNSRPVLGNPCCSSPQGTNGLLSVDGIR